MAYLPASRAVDSVGLHPMFRGRVSGVGSQMPRTSNEATLEEMKSWRSNTPIASWTATTPSGDKREVKVYGYNKEIGYVWLAEGPNSNAESSTLYPEFVLASKSPEWVAWKSGSGSGSGSGSALPLLLGAAFLLLS